jgi:hypothetical protein
MDANRQTMDDSRFDELARALANPSRRAIFSALTATLLGGALGSGGNVAEAKQKRGKGSTPDKRGKRSARRDHPDAVQASGKKKKRKKKKKAPTPTSPTAAPPPPGCVPESAAQTCAGLCGTVTNNCGTPVTCGSCVCSPACPLCQRCNAATGRCEPNPAFLGEVCGAPGQVCQADGTCACDSESCAAGQRCNGLACVCDGRSCPTGCCDGTTCRMEDDNACGTGGGACTTCTSCQVCNRAGQCEADLGQNRTSCQLAGGGAGVCCNGVCCAGCCDANDNCGACLAFVTSTQYTGNLVGGLAGADAKCQARAAAANFPGTYKAWLSNGTHSPATRFRCRAASCSAQGYKRVDGVTIANDWEDLTTCDAANGACLDAALNVTELNQFANVGVWSNTTTSGTVREANVHCQNWLAAPSSGGNAGAAGNVNFLWTATMPANCTAAFALYCFQQS